MSMKVNNIILAVHMFDYKYLNKQVNQIIKKH